MKRLVLTVTILTALLLALTLTSCQNKDKDKDNNENNKEDDGVTMNIEIYPKPVSSEISDRSSESADASLFSPSVDSYNAVFARFGLNIGQGGLPVEILTDGDMEDEEYSLSVRADKVTISSSSSRGAFYAICTLSKLCDGGRIAKADISDKPAVPFRGVIEGFYGTAWSHECRLDLMRFMGDNKMNTFIYAPKNDPKHRSEWRVAYTSQELEKMSELVKGAKENNVKFVFAISPGLDIDLDKTYDSELQKLFEKCQSLYDIGVRNFAIFLDDINSRDEKGHSKLLNDFQTGFIKTHEGCDDLLTVLPEYSDLMLTKYTDKLSPLLDPDITVMWTGTATTPASITVKDIEPINKKFGRKVYIWWNYPVNDMTRDRFFMGPAENLDKKLPGVISGFVSNPLNEGYASMLPLFTVAEYLWNPSVYNADESASHAAKALAPECPEALLTFMDLCRGSLINGDKSSFAISKEYTKFIKNEKDNAAALTEKLEKIKSDLALLREKGGEKLINDIKPWLDKAEKLVGASISLVRVYAEGDLKAGAMDYISKVGKLDLGGVTVSKDVLTTLLEGAEERIKSILNFTDKAEISFTCESATAFTDCKAYQDYKIDNVTDMNNATFFWSDGTLKQASNGGVGFVGIRFDGVKKIENVYLATGNNGKDALTNVILEYSEDGVDWKEVASGKYGEEVYLDGLDISASAIRVRNGDGSSNNWVIIRSFEANTTRFSEETPGVRVSTNMPTYQSHVPENVLDGLSSTYFWSSAAPNEKSYIMIDLGAVSPVLGVRLEMGTDNYPTDVIQRGVIEYSEDGENFTKLCSFKERSVAVDEKFSARYVRVRCVASQTKWVIIPEFKVIRGLTLPEGVSFDGNEEIDFSPIADGNIFTVFETNDLKGRTLTFDVRDKESAKIYFTSTEGVALYTVDKSGKKSDAIALSAVTELDAKGLDKLLISFTGGKAGIAEIVTG